MHKVLTVAQNGDYGNAQGIEETHEFFETLGVFAGAVGNDSQFPIATIDFGDQQQISYAA